MRDKLLENNENNENEDKVPSWYSEKFAVRVIVICGIYAIIQQIFFVFLREKKFEVLEGYQDQIDAWANTPYSAIPLTGMFVAVVFFLIYSYFKGRSK